MEIITLVLGALTILALIWMYAKSKENSNANEIPGPKGLPIFGSFFAVDMGNLHLTFWKWAKEYGPIFKVNLFGHTIVVLNDVELIREAFASAEFGSHLCDRPKTYVGQNLIYGAQDVALNEHYDERFKAIKNMFQISLKQSIDTEDYKRLLSEEFDRFILCLKETNGMDVEVTALCRRSLAEATSILVAGETADESGHFNLWKLNDNALELLEHSNSMLLGTFPFLRWFPCRIGKLYKNVMESKEWVVDHYYEKVKANKEHAKDSVVKMFIAQQKDVNSNKTGLVTEDNMRGTMIDIAVAAMKSTSSVLSGCLLLLLHNPECARRIQVEVDEVVGREQAPTLKDRPNMPYARAMVYEAIRYLSVGHLGLPHSVKEDKVFEGFQLRKDDIVYSNLWFINKSDKIWGDGDVFRPDRFLDVDGHILPADDPIFHNFIPFSVGRRQCPGKDLGLNLVFLYLTSTLQCIDLLPPSDGILTSVDPATFQPGLFLATNPFRGRFVERKL